MTQTNTKQNKEELERAINKCARESSDGIFVYKYIKDYYEKELSQAHQSGIEEERKRIAELVKQMLIEVPNGETCTKAELIDVLNKSLKENNQRSKMKKQVSEKKPRIVHTKTRNGYFCQYFGEDLKGIGALSSESPEMAELRMWEIVAEIRKRQLQLSPEMSNFSPMSKGYALIDPKLEMTLRVNGGLK